MKTKQSGNVVVGIIIGIVLGLAAALAVAVYVPKVPIPFLNKGPSRSAEQDAAVDGLRDHEGVRTGQELAIDHGMQLDTGKTLGKGVNVHQSAHLIDHRAGQPGAVGACLGDGDVPAQRDQAVVPREDVLLLHFHQRLTAAVRAADASARPLRAGGRARAAGPPTTARRWC